MELLQFRYFLAAARHENFTRAAEELHIAQPALSQSIKRLENELEVRLFDRKDHRIILNEQGRLLEKKLIPILDVIDHLKDELWESNYLSERTIYLNFFAASPFITNCIIAYQGLHPEVKFQVSQAENSENCDICIDSKISDTEGKGQFHEQFPGEIFRQEVLREEIFLAVPMNSPLASRKAVDLRELKDEGYIRLGHGWQLRSICDSFCFEAGIHPKGIFESNSPESVRNLIAAGLGIGFWPEKTWGGPPEGRVTLIPIRFPVCSRDIVVTMYEHAKEKPMVENFLNYICEYFEKEIPGNKENKKGHRGVR